MNLEVSREGAVLTLRLNRPKANILDGEMIGQLRKALASEAGDKDLKAILLTAAGPHFSFGASVAEHTPEMAGDMLKELHGLFRDIFRLSVPTVAAVRGQCLGGALELVLCASIVTVSPDAKLGQPEIQLGVFAPMASVMLPHRIGQARAERLLLSGCSIGAFEAEAIGLANRVADDPEAAARELIEKDLLDKSASSLRFALRAARFDAWPRIDQALEGVERLYLDELMKTHDACEGIASFLEKRKPEWHND